MAETLHPLMDFQICPWYSTIMQTYDANEIVPFHVQLISGAVVLAHELFTNANAKVKFVPLCLSFYNLEGATRIIYMQTLAGKILYSGSVTTATSILYQNQYIIAFDKLALNGALVNAGSTLTFNGLRITLN
jgi:hypothetical protein